MSKRDPKAGTIKQVIRCAIYTRKSTEEGLQQEFNSLDAQRESGEAYIAAQKHEGWLCLPDKYDDGGFSGGNIDRPAMQRLLADIDAGKIDCVVVYKVDRLSRSLMDFSRVMQTFERHQVSFVSVTQQFNTTHSMGRLTLNILLSFAQFEREIISERTRDKIAAARRKGKFAGGKPLLGYDLASTPAGAKLAVNEEEARRVRGIYELYLKHQALIPVVKELARRGWANKTWVTRKGETRGGRPFDKTTLYRLLTSRTYAGLVTYHEEVYPGEHAAIVDKELWERVRAVLGRNGKTGGAAVRNRYGALLKGLLHCSCCRCAMIHTYSVKGGDTAQAAKRYRYYVCLSAQKKGWSTCATKSVPAGEIERFVVEQIKSIGRDPAVLEGTLRQMRQQNEKAIADLQAEGKGLERELARHHTALRKLSTPGAGAPEAAKLAALHEQVREAEQKGTRVREAVLKLQRESIDRSEVSAALSVFDPVWEQLTPKEQARVIGLLVERVAYDGKAGTVAITFHATGIKALAQEQGHEVAA
jgi:site-specific DNA recombinase